YVFSFMSVAHFCDGVLAMHGCTPSKANGKLKDIDETVPKFFWTPFHSTIQHDLLWSDPSWAKGGAGGPKTGELGRGRQIGVSKFDEFLEGNPEVK
ncbi:hypothetical protein PMAYCL1PPCAC_26411, partial [Pristionchus mayeri]